MSTPLAQQIALEFHRAQERIAQLGQIRSWEALYPAEKELIAEAIQQLLDQQVIISGSGQKQCA